jgi:rubrerythrin
MSSKKIDATKLSTSEEKLLNSLVDKGIREIKPKRFGESIIYDGLEELIKDNNYKEVMKLLKSLKKKEYLTEHNYDSAIFCPRCGSIQVFSKYNCPQCQSMSIEKIQLIEHIFCGFIGNRNEFEGPDGLVCPKCKTIIGDFLGAQSKKETEKNKQIRVIGSSFVCDKCGSKFERPTTSHVCQNCKATFTYREASYEKLPSYELTDKIELLSPKRFERDALHQVEKIFSEKGYSVEIDGKIMGKSGVEQSFDLIARKDKKIILLDVSAWGRQTDLISLLGKKMDVDSQSIFLLDLGGNPNLSALAKPYNIVVLDGKDDKHMENLTTIIGEITDGAAEKHDSSFWKRGKK